MANAVFRPVDYECVSGEDDEEFGALLPPSSHHLIEHPSPRTLSPKPPGPRRQSSFAQARPDGTPRTPNRVRFDVEHPTENGSGLADSHWLDSHHSVDGRGRKASGRLLGQRAPLLTDMDAPSVLLACDNGGDDEDEDVFNPEDLLGTARPKSGMRSAFMNMANSIMWVADYCIFLYDHADVNAEALVSLDNHMLSSKQVSLPGSSFLSLLRSPLTGLFD